ncbi:MAG: hypothetical protein VYE73_18695 [Acidobacteriota bacterium]|nr:hypothetical protein [Acidobacteriota bacterium]
MRSHITITALLTALALLAAPVLAAEGDGIERTASGRPDFSGNYDVSTLTPFTRPEEFGDNLELTPEEASAITEKELARVALREANRGPVEQAPPDGGAPPIGVGEEFRERGGAGNVGGYNNFWTDRGTDVFSVDGKFRTSILVDPPNGRMPESTAAARERFSQRRKFFRPNDGSAWWVELDGAGPYDGPESLPTSERCVLGFTGAAPTFPSLYNNFKSIVQTEDHVMILIEMVHDARIVRMNSEHPGPGVTKWLGDSIGWWEGDTLVVDTTNFHPKVSVRGGTSSSHVVERFTAMADGNVLYRFTVEDPNTWKAPWTGEYVWRSSPNRVYEYACHEGNYSMGGTLRGARLLESEAHAKGASGGE